MKPRTFKFNFDIFKGERKMEKICKGCKNHQIYEKKEFPNTEIGRCVFGISDIDGITKCSHFQKKHNFGKLT